MIHVAGQSNCCEVSVETGRRVAANKARASGDDPLLL